MLKRDSSKNTTFRHSACQWWRSRAHCSSLSHWWSMDNGSRCNGMWATSPALKRWQRSVDADRSKAIAVLQRRFNTVDEAVWFVTAMWTRWWSSYAIVTLRGPVPVRHSSKPCMSSNVMIWYTCFPETNHSAPFECTHLLILRPFASMKHICTSSHVSTLFGSSARTEQGITLTLLVTLEMSLLGLYICHLSGNVFNYWWYTGLHISQVWSRSNHSVWVLHFNSSVLLFYF